MTESKDRFQVDRYRFRDADVIVVECRPDDLRVDEDARVYDILEQYDGDWTLVGQLTVRSRGKSRGFIMPYEEISPKLLKRIVCTAIAYVTGTPYREIREKTVVAVDVAVCKILVTDDEKERESLRRNGRWE